MNELKNSGLRVGLWAGAWIAGVVLLTPHGARAGDWSFSLGIGSPAVQVREVYAEPVTELRTRRVWVEPVYALREVAVEVPAVVRTRRSPTYDQWGRVIEYRLVREVIEPAGVEYQKQRVLVREGFYKTITERVRVSSARALAVRRPIDPGFRFGFGYQKNRHRHHWRRDRGFRAGFRH